MTYLLSSIDAVVDSIPAVYLDTLCGVRMPEVVLTRWGFVTPQEVVKLLDGKALLFANDTTICHTWTLLAGVIREMDSLLSRA
ncbi:hypothetical protein J6590_066580 [Homalodisca vitripennis]|nr:hypothetical protein J6590_066580 [Homalodisca vitripennis]